MIVRTKFSVLETDERRVSVNVLPRLGVYIMTFMIIAGSAEFEVGRGGGGGGIYNGAHTQILYL